MKQLPSQLKRNKGLARAHGQRQQHALLPRCDGRQHLFNCHVLVAAPLKVAAPVFKRRDGKTVAPGVMRCVGQLPRLAAAIAGSMCSARVSASFMVNWLRECSIRQGLHEVKVFADDPRDANKGNRRPR